METTSTPKNFFIQFGIISSLYIFVASFLSLVFDLINKCLPDSTNGNYYVYDSTSGSIRFAVSILAVFFPLFIYLSRLYRKLLANDSALKESKVRKWLLYFTLFLSGVTIAVDSVFIINTFPNGDDLTLRFILKALSVLIVSIAVFGFYIKDIKGYWELNPNRAKQVAYVVVFIVTLVIVVTCSLIDSPATLRKKNSDSMKLSDLSRIQSNIVNFYQHKGVLPANLSLLNDPLSDTMTRPDDTSYTYKVTGALSFELCATFELSSESNQNVDYYDYGVSGNWDHKAGEACFARTIDPDKYPSIKLNPVD